MKNAIKAGLLTSALALSSCASMPNIDEDRVAIQQILSAYETALNSKDAETIITLYADDGIFMPQHRLPQVGKAAVRAAYADVFDAITLNIEFTVDEIEPVSANWAFARTRSEGTVTINATGQSGPEANQELFLFHRMDEGGWKIARYIFSTTNPPRQ